MLVLVGFTIVSLAACGSGSSNPTEISFNVAPPADLQVGGTATISATVFNNNNTGVNWTVSCGSADCGSFNPTSGASTVYTAPAAVPSGNTVTITATAAAKSSVTVMATVTITSGSTGTALNGQYAFLISGSDSNGSYVAAGSLVADGNGNITGGEEDLCDFTGCFSGLESGTFSTGSDGRGSINISSSGLGPQTFDIVVTSSSHALIIEFDGSASSSGTLDLQDATALTASSVSGGYSMTLSGFDISGATAVANAFGVVMTADGSGGFPSVSIDQNDGGNFTPSQSDALSVQSGPDQFGRVQISDGTTLEFAYYIVNAKALRVIELDGNFLTSGSAYTEGTGSLSVANLAGNSVFTVSEVETAKGGPAGVGGEFTATDSGSIAPGFVDVNDDGSLSTGSIAGSTLSSFSGARGMLVLSGGVSSDITQFQVYLVDPGVNILDPTNSTGGGGALLLDTDSNAVGAGTIIPVTSGAQFSGNYGLNVQALTSNNENDLEGQVMAASSALNGNGDLNNFPTQLLSAETLTGSFTPDSSNPGRFTGSLMVGSFGTFDLVYYQASNSQIVIVEMDKGQIGTGVLVAQ